MSKISVKVNQPSLKSIVKNVNAPKYTQEIGKVIVREMLNSIARGISPVRNERRFVKYSDGYSRAIRKQYKSITDYSSSKKVRPVNLNLSGQMLRALTYKSRRGALQIGIFTSDMAKRAKKHQLGLDGVPRRRFIPAQNGEELTVSIMRQLKNEYVKIIDSIIKSS